MKYPKEYLDEIKLRLKVSQVVGKSVKLKKRGKEFIGLSPFSNEKNLQRDYRIIRSFKHQRYRKSYGIIKTKIFRFN